MHEVAAFNIGDFSQQRDLFTHTNEVNPTDLSNNETTPSQNH